MHDLRVWPKVLADPSPQSSTPGKARDANDQMTRLAKVRVYQFRQLLENPLLELTDNSPDDTISHGKGLLI